MALDTEPKRAKPEAGAAGSGRAIAADATRAAGKGDDADSRRFSIAVSSEYPVQRWYGDEILVHEADAIDGEFFGSGRAPLLMDHDTTRQIGVIESYSLGSDKVLRASIRFSKSEEAQAIQRDVEDGIRGNVSIGYRIHDFKPLPKDAGYRITKWSPHEASFVSVPADPKVGVGRDLEPTPPFGKRKMEHEIIEDDEDRFSALRLADQKAERHGVLDEFRKKFGPEVTRGLTAHEIDKRSTEIIKNLLPISKALTDQRIGAPAHHLAGERGALTFLDFCQAGAGLSDDTGQVREHSQEMARRSGRKLRTANSFVMNLGVLADRAATFKDDASGAIFDEHLAARYVEQAYAESACFKAGVQFIAVQGNPVIPVEETKPVPTWHSDTVTPPSDTVFEIGSVTGQNRMMILTLTVSRMLLQQSSPEISGIVARSFRNALTAEMDRVITQGSGSSNQPTGVGVHADIPTIAMGTNGAAIDYETVVRMQEMIETADLSSEHCAYITNPKVKRALLTVPREAGMPTYVLDDRSPDKLIGRPIYYSTNVKSDASKGSGTNLSSIFFGDWQSAVVVPVWSNIELLFDPFSLSKVGALNITAIMNADVIVRNPNALVRILDVVTA